MSKSLRRLIFAVLAAVAVPGAATACLFGWLTRVAVCEEGCPAHIPPIFEVQLIVALGGLVPTLVLLGAAVVWRPKIAAVALVSGLAMYAGWALLNNFAVHGSAFGG